MVTTSVRRHHRYTYADYLKLEQGSTVRHEFVDGEIYAMAGGTPTHAALAATIIRLVGARLPAGYRAYTSDLRVRVPSTGLSTYPDVSVVCGPTVRAADDPLAVTNPVVVVEVTSPSTEDYDRGEKIAHYQRLPSVREILVVSHWRPELLLFHRGPGDDWQAAAFATGETVELSAIGATLLVDDVYRSGIEDLDSA